MKFIVDDVWKCSDLYDTIEDADGNINNLLVVDLVSTVDDEERDATRIKSETELASLESNKVTDYLNEVVVVREEVVTLKLKWCGTADNVLVKGNFTNWQPLSMVKFQNDLWNIDLKIKQGKHLLKFNVDGKDTISEYLETVTIDEETFNVLNIVSHAIDNSIENSTEAMNVTDDEVTDVSIDWKGVADTVMVSGEFSNWTGISLAKTKGDSWTVQLKLKHGQYLLMFFVDGEIVLSEDMKQVTGEDDEQYNVIEVKPFNDQKCDAVAETDQTGHLEISNDEVDGNQLDEQNILQNNIATETSLDHENNEDSCEKQIAWFGFADDVKVIGDFSNWTPISLSNNQPEYWCVTLKLQEGPHLLKFIVDKKFTLSEQMEKVIGPDQEIYNLIHVGTNNSLKYEIR